MAAIGMPTDYELQRAAAGEEALTAFIASGRELRADEHILISFRVPVGKTEIIEAAQALSAKVSAVHVCRRERGVFGFALDRNVNLGKQLDETQKNAATAADHPIFRRGTEASSPQSSQRRSRSITSAKEIKFCGMEFQIPKDAASPSSDKCSE